MSENATAADAVVGSDATQDDVSTSIVTAPLARTDDPTPAPAQPSFDEAIKDLQQAAKAAEAAERQHRRAFVELCAKLFKFKHNRDAVDVGAWLEEKGLKVTAKANEWTAVVKLAFAVKQADEKWTVSNAQVNKYANVMRYAEATGIKEGEMEEWIGERTLTEMISAARLGLRETGDDEREKPDVKFDRYLGQLKETWEPFFEKGLPKKVDLTQAPVQAGKVQIMAEVDDKGNITPLGIMQVDQPKLLSLLAPPKSKTPLADDLSQSISGVKTLYSYADLLPMNASVQRSIILDVDKDKWRIYVCEPNQWSCPIAEAIFAQPHLQIPAGKWFLDSAKQKALSFLLNTFPAEMINVSANKTHCLITIQDSDNKTVEAHIEEINERKKKSWQSAKAKKKTTATEPPTFDWPEGGDDNVLALPDASGMKVAKLHQDVEWTDTEVAASKQFRNDVAFFCDKQAGDGIFYKVRLGATQMSVFRSHGGDPITSIKYGKKAKAKLEGFFAINKLVLSRAMHAMNFAIGNAPCQLSLSDGKTVLRLSAEHNGGEYNIYIPAVGLGYDYAGDEFSMSRLA